MADRACGAKLHLTEYRFKPTLAWNGDSVTIYGGPVATWQDGSYGTFWPPMGAMVTIHTRAESGGFAGANWQIHPRVTLTAEGEITEISRAAVVGAAYRF